MHSQFSEHIHQVLSDVFGYSSFRSSQEEIIVHLLNGEDALVLMPTGGGKSLCYQIPAIIKQGVGLVVSPLIALMQDQVQALRELGVEAYCLNSSISREEYGDAVRSLHSGQCKLLYVAPERLLKTEFLDFISQFQISIIAIDEAHCISQWGHDFRPEYAQLGVLQERFPQVPRIALTATADVPTRRDILRLLKLENARCFEESFDRPNIAYYMGLKRNPLKQLKDFIKERHSGDSGIVYCQSRKKVESVAESLRKEGYAAYPYHAGLSDVMRTKHQDIFIREENIIIVATIAFGMGIDKSNVRFVAHLDLPKSVEAYYQETGRAGRDGLPATAWMLYGMADIVVLRQMLHSSQASDEIKRIESHKLNALVGLAETIECRRRVLLKYFGEDYGRNCGNCDTCLEPVDTWDGTLRAQQVLSCVYRTGQRFGASYLIDVLRGKDNERITRFGHNRLKVFGIDSDVSPQEWSSVFRQLIAAGYLQVDVEGYGGMQMTALCAPVPKGEAKVTFRRDIIASKKRKSKEQKIKRELSLSAEGAGLFERLRQHRLKLARAQGVPPYVIFHDRTLMEMAENRPRSLDELSLVSGVGSSKLGKYGNAFLSLINDSVD